MILIRNYLCSFVIFSCLCFKGSCRKDWARYRNNCYFVLKIGFGHIDASNECAKIGGSGSDLVSILDDAENTFVFELLQNRTYFYNAWVGLTNEAIVRGYVHLF